jgi:hypothetical protein
LLSLALAIDRLMPILATYSGLWIVLLPLPFLHRCCYQLSCHLRSSLQMWDREHLSCLHFPMVCSLHQFDLQVYSHPTCSWRSNCLERVSWIVRWSCSISSPPLRDEHVWVNFLLEFCTIK